MTGCGFGSGIWELQWRDRFNGHVIPIEPPYEASIRWEENEPGEATVGFEMSALDCCPTLPRKGRYELFARRDGSSDAFSWVGPVTELGDDGNGNLVVTHRDRSWWAYESRPWGTDQTFQSVPVTTFLAAAFRAADKLDPTGISEIVEYSTGVTVTKTMSGRSPLSTVFDQYGQVAPWTMWGDVLYIGDHEIESGVTLTGDAFVTGSAPAVVDTLAAVGSHVVVIGENSIEARWPPGDDWDPDIHGGYRELRVPLSVSSSIEAVVMAQALWLRAQSGLFIGGVGSELSTEFPLDWDDLRIGLRFTLDTSTLGSCLAAVDEVTLSSLQVDIINDLEVQVSGGFSPARDLGSLDSGSLSADELASSLGVDPAGLEAGSAGGAFSGAGGSPWTVSFTGGLMVVRSTVTQTVNVSGDVIDGTMKLEAGESSTRQLTGEGNGFVEINGVRYSTSG